MLGRGWAAQPLADSLAASGADARLLFIVNVGDRDTKAACAATGADVLAAEWPPGPGDYARKINMGAAYTSEPWIFTGASDLVFHPGWLAEAMKLADDGAFHGVIGTNDLGNSLVRAGRHSTHSLVHREYAQTAVIDEPGHIYCEQYDHNYCDMEMIDYALWRNRFRPARRSIVEHLHPDWRKGQRDPTYERGKARFRDDQALWLERRHLWRPPDPAQARREAARARIRRNRPV